MQTGSVGEGVQPWSGLVSGGDFIAVAGSQCPLVLIQVSWNSVWGGEDRRQRSHTSGPSPQASSMDSTISGT